MRVENKNILLDLEFTCSESDQNNKDAEIIEIGMVKTEFGEIVDIYHTLVYTDKEISEKCTELTGITQDMVEDAPKLEDIVEEITEFIGDYQLLAWGNSDRTVFLKNLKDRELSKHLLYTTIFRNCQDLMVFFMDFRKIKYRIGLDKAIRISNAEQIGPRHHALYDSVNMLSIILYMDAGGRKYDKFSFPEEVNPKSRKPITEGEVSYA